MRKIVSILLIFILLFNLGGYRIVIPLLQEHSDRKLEALLDNNEYDESQLIEVRVALNMPYQQRFTEYERHYGQIELNGHSYTYVKRKVEGDVVIFKCIANESKQQLKAIQNDITRAGSAADMDHPGQSKQQPSSFAKNILSDYDGQHQFYVPASFASLNAATSFNYAFFIPDFTTNTPHQPPEC
ncbi:MAG: hypothetical protein WDO16_00440 [Bacteroidota bacterium]